MQVQEQTANSRTTRKQSSLRWLATFLGFPLGGLAATLISGRVDSLSAALVGGAITGTILGAVQSWGMGPAGPPARRWITATTAGFMVGLGIGAAVVGYHTSIGALVVQGAICGLAVGTLQAGVLRTQLGRRAYVWAPALGGLWALGWAVTTSIGIDVDQQFTQFGASGAIVVTAATAVLPVFLARRAEATAS